MNKRVDMRDLANQVLQQAGKQTIWVNFKNLKLAVKSKYLIFAYI